MQQLQQQISVAGKSSVDYSANAAQRRHPNGTVVSASAIGTTTVDDLPRQHQHQHAVSDHERLSPSTSADGPDPRVTSADAAAAYAAGTSLSAASLATCPWPTHDLAFPSTSDSTLETLLSSFDKLHSNAAAAAAATPIATEAPTTSSTHSVPVAVTDASRRLAARLADLTPPLNLMSRSDQRSRYNAQPSSVPSENAYDGAIRQRNHSLTSSARLPNIFKTSRNASVDMQAAASFLQGRQGSQSSISPMRGYSQDATSGLMLPPGDDSKRDAQSASMLSRGRPVPSMYSSFTTSNQETPSPSPSSPPRNIFATHVNPLSSNPHIPIGYRPSELARKAPFSKPFTSTSPAASTSESPIRSPKTAREQASEFVRINSTQELYPSSSHSNVSLPPGTIQRYPGMSPGEERRGFFKRVFFSSTSRPNLAGDLSNSANTSPAASRSNSLAQQVHDSPKMSPDPGRNGEGSTPTLSANPQVQPHQLHKKPSFFRRRKRSLTDNGTPPTLPPTLLPKELAGDSSGGSLYQALNPYISSPDVQASSLDGTDTSGLASGSPSSDSRPIDAARTGSPIRMRVRKRDQPASPGQFALISPVTPDLSGQAASRSPSSSVHTFTIVETHDPARSPRVRSPHTPETPKVPAPKSELVLSTASPAAAQSEFVVTKNPIGPQPDTRLRLCESLDELLESRKSSLVYSATRDTFYTPTSEIDKDRSFKAPSSIPNELGLAIQSLDGPSSSQVDSQIITAEDANTQNDLANHEDKIRAQQIYQGDESAVTKELAAAYLGDAKPSNVETLRLYMSIFDFTSKTILAGLRMLCDNLVLKAESQAVDRILQAFSERWAKCNPNNGFKLTDVVHTMCYSLLLLNTDLHMADIESKMTRGQFVKNTLPNIKRIIAEAATSAELDRKQSRHAAKVPRRPSLPWKDSSGSVAAIGDSPQPDAHDDQPAQTESKRPGLTKRMSSTFSGVLNLESFNNEKSVTSANAGVTLLVDDPFDGKLTEWYAELEVVLKSFFTAVKNDPLPLNKQAAPRKESVGLIPTIHNSRRTPSIKSVTPSETMSMRSKKTDFHSMTSRWGKGRFRNKIYASSTLGSSRTSFDDSNSLFTPATSAWSKYSRGMTATTMSTDSFAKYGADQGFHQSIGFANALSHAYIREDGSPSAEEDEEFNAQKFLLEDETLELAGAPWAKEGMVKHKYHLEAKGKKAKERDWCESFAVIEKGYLRLFSFNSKGGKSGSLGMKKHAPQKGKAASIAPSVVGGGNWMQNAEQQACFLLRQTIASTLPPPGYSKARPNVWALSLPTGAVHLFQVGTPQIAEEFRSTANYWSARLSKEPLTGGVDNIEYGWSDNIINSALLSDTADSPHPQSSRSGPGSVRGSMDHTSSKTRLAGDRVHIEDWRPPAQSMLASQLMAVDQLRGLRNYVTNVEKELSKHNDLRQPMTLAYSPRSANLAKALSNWEKKSSYLLRENVKFTTYTDALEHAEKEKVLHDKELEERAKMKEAREARQAQQAAADEAAKQSAAAGGKQDTDLTPRQSQIVEIAV